jgi:hypothetical protein
MNEHEHNENGARVPAGEITIGGKVYKVTKIYCTCGTHVNNNSQWVRDL